MLFQWDILFHCLFLPCLPQTSGVRCWWVHLRLWQPSLQHDYICYTNLLQSIYNIITSSTGNKNVENQSQIKMVPAYKYSTWKLNIDDKACLPSTTAKVSTECISVVNKNSVVKIFSGKISMVREPALKLIWLQLQAYQNMNSIRTEHLAGALPLEVTITSESLTLFK